MQLNITIVSLLNHLTVQLRLLYNDKIYIKNLI